jgi:hypothetical protein
LTVGLREEKGSSRVMEMELRRFLATATCSLIGEGATSAAGVFLAELARGAEASTFFAELARGAADFLADSDAVRLGGIFFFFFLNTDGENTF